jgi:hypothetical protein
VKDTKGILFCGLHCLLSVGRRPQGYQIYKPTGRERKVRERGKEREKYRGREKRRERRRERKQISL